MPAINKRYPYETFKVAGLNLNALNDVRIPIQFSKYAVHTFTITNTSTSLGASAAQVGLYTLPAKAGTAISTGAVATALTSAPVLQDRTLATTNVQTGDLYVNVGVVHGSAATCDAFVEIQQIG